MQCTHQTWPQLSDFVGHADAFVTVLIHVLVKRLMPNSRLLVSSAIACQVIMTTQSRYIFWIGKGMVHIAVFSMSKKLLSELWF